MGTCEVGRLPASLLVTGAAGYVGRLLVERLAADPHRPRTLIAADLRCPSAERRRPGVLYERVDVRSDRLQELLVRHRVEAVVHLASIVSPPPGMDRAEMWSIDVGGTRRTIEACRAAGVRHLVVTTSGAAYGYHPDNPAWIDEDAPLRGNEAFAYAAHKREVEDLLAAARRDDPNLKQLVLRPGTILGEPVRNPITRLFDMPVVIGVRGRSSPFVIVWDRDLVEIIVEGLERRLEGVFNVAGEGTVSLREMAQRLGRPFVPLPAGLLRRILRLLRLLGATRYGPEQVDFLAHRPVLSNRRLVATFRHELRKTSSEVFDTYLRARGGPLTGKVAVVTGAAGGIGSALCHHLARLGADLGLIDVDAGGLDRLAASLARRGVRVSVQVCDIRAADRVRTSFAALRRDLGPCDILINNAGLSHRSLFRHTPIDVFRHLMEVNYLGAVHCTAAALDDIRSRRGRIVAISSVAGIGPLIGRTGYAASKHALHGFFDTLRTEEGPGGVHVMIACPSFTRTAIDRSLAAGKGPKATVGRVAEPDEVARQIIAGLLRRRRIVALGAVGKTADLLRRLAPALYAGLMRRRLGGEFEAVQEGDVTPGPESTSG